MIQIIYFDERELLVGREIETEAPKDTETEVTEVLPMIFMTLLFEHKYFMLEDCWRCFIKVMY